VHIYEGLPLPDTPANIPAERIRHVSEPTALQALHQLGRHLGWTGYGQIDFIRRPDGLLFFLEFNPRLWSSVTAADAAGNDLLGVLADRALGRPMIEDLDNRDGWTGLVYPKPVHRLVRAGQFRPLLHLLIQGELRRSRPRHSWSLELGSRFLRTAYWSWQSGRKSRI
jgi:predicted ATP-grasp superfamily ATP-dependent carboligase